MLAMDVGKVLVKDSVSQETLKAGSYYLRRLLAEQLSYYVRLATYLIIAENQELLIQNRWLAAEPLTTFCFHPSFLGNTEEEQQQMLPELRKESAKIGPKTNSMKSKFTMKGKHAEELNLVKSRSKNRNEEEQHMSETRNQDGQRGRNSAKCQLS